MNFPAEPAFFRAEAPAHAAADHEAAVGRLRAALDAAFAACTAPADPSRCARFAQALRAALGAALADHALVTAAEREGSATTYRRHLILADREARYTVAALVWQPGQASPVHAHHTWCGYAVLEGTLTETIYTWDEAREGAAAVRAHPRAPGAVSFGGRGRQGIHRLIHRLANESDAAAVSLHIYGVSAARMATGVNEVLPLLPAVAHDGRAMPITDRP
ncbi:cysteine dioxygenase family protein [Paraburkholderia ferrariae]|uniref:cysteine dioxygenase family protein n=1 Tax=Paraburkholderia ferrariae TaxID=386056 RepID=UPI0005A7D309|nr:cysteine dioxygenase family protein [Paraburkholderia ferrariae]